MCDLEKTYEKCPRKLTEQMKQKMLHMQQKQREQPRRGELAINENNENEGLQRSQQPAQNANLGVQPTTPL